MVSGVLKRSLLIVLAVILLAFAVIAIRAYVEDYIYVYIHPANPLPLSWQPWRIEAYRDLILLFEVATMALSVMCALATVDMLVCVAQKKYSMCMFGIGIALFALMVLRIVMSLFAIDYSIYIGAWIDTVMDESYYMLLVYTLGHVVFLCGFIGLAIAYVCAKKKYLSSLSNE